MKREVGAELVLRAAGPAQVALAVAAVSPVWESLTATAVGGELPSREFADLHGGRVHVLDLPEGETRVRYAAEVDANDVSTEVADADVWRYLRPSRYCESDAIRPLAIAEFQGVAPADLLTAVSSWVGTSLAYVPGSSGPLDGAVDTYLARRGVCRDYAHLVIALLRALDVPARLAAVYAPGLDPMDFHAVAEAAVDGRWRVVDATTLAPRSALVRIATGRDASDTAFLNTRGAPVELVDLHVSAITTERLPSDDISELVSL